MSAAAKKTPDPLDLAIACTGLFAIASQSIHAFFDFGLYLPANMCLLALLCGVLHGRCSVARVSARPHFITAIRASLLTATCFLLSLASINLLAHDQVSASLRSVPQPALADQREESHPPAVRECELASRISPNHAETRLRAAQAWVDRFRRTALEALVAQQPTADPQELWELTAMAEVHTLVCQFAQSEQLLELDEFRSSRNVRDNLVPAARHLYAARAGCPLLPDVHLLLCEIDPIISSYITAGQGVERVRVCAPRRAPMLAEAGLVAMVDGQFDIAASLWQQAVTIEPQRLPVLVKVAASEPEMNQRLEKLLPESPAQLVRSLREIFAQTDDVPLQARLIKHARHVLTTTTIDTPQRTYLEGILFWVENRKDQAIERLTQAITLEPMEVTWRFDLATLLAETGQPELARQHATVCLRTDPQNEFYLSLFQRLVQDPQTHK